MRNREYTYPALILLVVVAAPAHAYIDPGSGSAIMSAIIGLFVAISLAVKTYWYKIKSLFSSQKPANASEDEESEPPQNGAKKPQAPVEER